MEDSKDKRIRDLHKKELGLKTPDDYFSSTKKELLNQISMEKSAASIPFYREKVFLAIAATVVILITLVIFKPKVFPSVNEFPKIVFDTIEQLKGNEALTEQVLGQKENDILISSLFMEDHEIDEFVDSYVLEEVFFDEAYSQ